MTPTSVEVRDQVKRILESDTFSAAPQISRLLSFLTDAALQGEPLKEVVIGTAFFNRPSGYDPQTDPVVRTEVRRLRLKLSEYYHSSGTGDPVLIEIPQGAYKARFTVREVAQPETAPAVAAVQAPEPAAAAALITGTHIPSRRVGLLVKALAAAAALLIAAGIWLLPRATGHAGARRSVVVFRFRDLDGGNDTAWLGKALSEMIAMELSGSGNLQKVPLDDDARTRQKLALGDVTALGSSDLSRIQRALGADLVVSGSYVIIGPTGSRQYRIDAKIYDARKGQAIGSVSDTSDERTLFDMVSRVGSQLQKEAGIEVANSSEKQLASATPVSLLDTKSLSKIEVAKMLCLKAQYLPLGAEREQLYVKALETGRKEGSGPWEVQPLNGLAQIYFGRREFEKAADYYRQAYEASLKYHGPDNADTAEAKVHWARSRIRLGERKEAVEMVKEAIPVARRGMPADSIGYWNVLHDAIHTCNDGRDFKCAEAFTLEAFSINEHLHLPQTSERWGMLYWDLGRAKKGEKNYREAIVAFEKAEADFQQFPDTRTAEVQKDIEQTQAEMRASR